MKLQFIFASLVIFALFLWINASPIASPIYKIRKTREADFETNSLEAKLLQSRLQTLNGRFDDIPISRGEECTYGIGGTYFLKAFASGARIVNGPPQPQAPQQGLLPQQASRQPVPVPRDFLVRE